MMCNRTFPYLPAIALPLLLTAALAGCSTPSDDQAPADQGVVTVTTASPKKQAFHDTVEAWGSAVSDPQRARALSLGHGGQLKALDVSPGQSVTRGQTLLVIVPDPATRSAYQQAANARDLARSELQRTQQMLTQHLATQSQLAAARKSLADAQSAWEAQRALGGGMAEETLTAPSDGVVSALAVAQGDRFAANAPLLTFTPAHALVAELGIQPPDGARLHPGMTVTLDRVYGSDASLDGTLSVIGAAVDPQTHLLPARVTLPAQASASVIAGDPLRASIQTSDFTAWAVPRAAVLHDEQGDYLYQVEQGKARRVAVTLRRAQGDPVAVSGSLDPKAGVIVQGVYELDNGEAVQEARP